MEIILGVVMFTLIVLVLSGLILAARAKLVNSGDVVIDINDDPQNQIYPMPIYTSDKNDVYVGRLRRDESAENSFNMWVVGDQIRKGAALNTLQIAETMIKNGWI